MLKIRKLIKHLLKSKIQIDIINKANLEDIVKSPEVARPTLEFSGNFNYYEPSRIQVVGIKEKSVFNDKSNSDKKEIINSFFVSELSCVIFSHGSEISKEMIKAAVNNNVTIIKTNISTSSIISSVTSILTKYLSEEISIHGSLVSINGIGTMIMGKSGIGKSEAVLEIINLGHQFICDDRVIAKQQYPGEIFAYGPKNISHLLEIRGVGIIDVRSHFGIKAVQKSSTIDLVIFLKYPDEFDENKDRLGIEKDYYQIFDTNIICHTIAIKPGKNISNIINALTLKIKEEEYGNNPLDKILTGD